MSIETGPDPDSEFVHQSFTGSDGSAPTDGIPAAPEPRKTGRFLALGIALLVFLGALGFFFLRGSNGTALALAFSQGQTTRFHMTLSMDASLSVGSGAAAQSVPLKFTSSSDVQWKVQSVDSAGTATVKMSLSNVSVSSNGQSQTAPSQPALTIHVTRDGRVLSTSGLTIASSGSGEFPGLSSTDQISALLPDHVVKPGDTWTKSVSQTMFGSSISFQASGTYLRNEKVGAVTAAVIQSKATIPMHFTLTGADLASVLPGLHGALPSNAKIGEAGQVATASTTWIDPAAKKLLKTQATGTFTIDMTASTGGLAEGSNLALRMSGTESITFTAR